LLVLFFGLEDDREMFLRNVGRLSTNNMALHPRSGQVGFVVDNVAPGQVFSEYFGFPCQFIPPNSPSSQSPGAGIIGQ
jgi:hypothetical protein